MAYAALLSLAQILHQTLNRDYQYLILDEKKQIESLVEEVTFLQNCLSSQKLTQDTETKIRDAAYIAEDIIESRIIDRFLTESAGHEDGSKEKILIRFDVMESWFVNSSKFDVIESRSTLIEVGSWKLNIAEVLGIVTIDGIRQLAKTRRFKAWFLDPSIFLDFQKQPRPDAIFLDFEGQPRPDAICALERLATYGTKMVIISDSSNPASTTMEKLKILGFDTSLFVGAITREDLRADDAGFEQPGPSHIDVTTLIKTLWAWWKKPATATASNLYDREAKGTKEDLRKSLFTTVAKSTTENVGPSSLVIKMYKSAMVMAGGVDAADCIAVGSRLDVIEGANAAGISSVFVDPNSLHLKLSARHDDALARPTYMLPSFTW